MCIIKKLANAFINALEKAVIYYAYFVNLNVFNMNL